MLALTVPCLLVLWEVKLTKLMQQIMEATCTDTLQLIFLCEFSTNASKHLRLMISE